MEWFRSFFFYFLIYSFLGWIIEGLFTLATKGYFIKPNFLFFPIKPMYGFAAVWLIELKSILPMGLFLIAAFFIPSIIEYLTAYVLSHLFHLKYWDYSHCAYQLSGYICLRFSIYWFFLCLSLIYGLHPYVAYFYTQIHVFWFYFFPTSLFVFLTDLVLTFHHKPIYWSKQRS